MVFVTQEWPHTTFKKERIPLGYKHDDPKKTRLLALHESIMGVFQLIELEYSLFFPPSPSPFSANWIGVQFIYFFSFLSPLVFQQHELYISGSSSIQVPGPLFSFLEEGRGGEGMGEGGPGTWIELEPKKVHTHTS